MVKSIICIFIFLLYWVETQAQYDKNKLRVDNYVSLFGRNYIRPTHPDSVLYLSVNAIHYYDYLPKYTWEYKNLNSLNIEGQNIKAIPDSILIFEKLKFLFLSANKITELPTYLTKLKEIKIIDLDLNNLQKVPLSAFNFNTKKQIERLNLSNSLGSRLEFIEDTIVSTSSISELWLEGCRIYSLPDGFFGFRSLDLLLLGNCRLTHLPPSIKNLKSLGVLDISHNPITELPIELAELDLGVIDISFTKITKFPDVFYLMPGLSQIKLHGILLDISDEEKIAITERLEKMNRSIFVNW